MFISKELLSEILKHKYNRCENIINFNVMPTNIYIQFEKQNHNLSIYEFAFKAKEWALDNGYIVNYSVSKNEDIFRHTIYIEEIKSNKVEEVFIETKDFIIDMEIKFTMMAYRVILDEKEGS